MERFILNYLFHEFHMFYIYFILYFFMYLFLAVCAGDHQMSPQSSFSYIYKSANRQMGLLHC